MIRRATPAFHSVSNLVLGCLFSVSLPHYSEDAQQGPFDLGRVRAVAKAGVLLVKDGEWEGPREDNKYVSRRRWHASML